MTQAPKRPAEADLSAVGPAGPAPGAAARVVEIMQESATTTDEDRAVMGRLLDRKGAL